MGPRLFLGLFERIGRLAVSTGKTRHLRSIQVLLRDVADCGQAYALRNAAAAIGVLAAVVMHDWYWSDDYDCIPYDEFRCAKDTSRFYRVCVGMIASMAKDFNVPVDVAIVSRDGLTLGEYLLKMTHMASPPGSRARWARRIARAIRRHAA